MFAELPVDLLDCIVSWIDSWELCALVCTCRPLHLLGPRLASGKMVHHCRLLIQSTAHLQPFDDTTYSVPRLMRFEAFLGHPHHGCASCLRRYVGETLGLQCHDCVGMPFRELGPTPMGTFHCPHTGPVAYYCPVCDASCCFLCFFYDTSCGMCRAGWQQLMC
jgi:hypothetical protein